MMNINKILYGNKFTDLSGGHTTCDETVDTTTVLKGVIVEKKCDYCGCVFTLPAKTVEIYAYKLTHRGKRKIFCRYNHMVAYEKEHKKK